MANYYYDKFNVITGSPAYYDGQSSWTSGSTAAFAIGYNGGDPNYNFSSSSGFTRWGYPTSLNNVGDICYVVSSTTVVYKYTVTSKDGTTVYCSTQSQTCVYHAAIPDAKGTLVESDIIAADGTYPVNGVLGGFWWVRKGIYYQVNYKTIVASIRNQATFTKIQFFRYLKTLTSNISIAIPAKGLGLKYSTIVGPSIDVGADAINRANTDGGWSGYFLLGLENPVNTAGVIDTITIWPNTALTGTQVALFYLVSGTTYMCRSAATIGTLPAGSAQTITGLNLACEVGDFLGYYRGTGSLEYSSTGQPTAVLRASGSAVVGSSKSFSTLNANGALSLYGNSTPTLTLNYEKPISYSVLTNNIQLKNSSKSLSILNKITATPNRILNAFKTLATNMKANIVSVVKNVRKNLISNSINYLKSGKNICDGRKLYSLLSMINSSNVFFETKDGRNCLKITNPNLYYPKAIVRNFSPGRYTFKMEVFYQHATSVGLIFRLNYTDGTQEVGYIGADSLTVNTWMTQTRTSAIGKDVKSLTVSYGDAAAITYINLDVMQIEAGTSATSFEQYCIPMKNIFKNTVSQIRLSALNIKNAFKIIVNFLKVRAINIASFLMFKEISTIVKNRLVLQKNTFKLVLNRISSRVSFTFLSRFIKIIVSNLKSSILKRVDSNKSILRIVRVRTLSSSIATFFKEIVAFIKNNSFNKKEVGNLIISRIFISEGLILKDIVKNLLINFKVNSIRILEITKSLLNNLSISSRKLKSIGKKISSRISTSILNIIMPRRYVRQFTTNFIIDTNLKHSGSQSATYTNNGSSTGYMTQPIVGRNLDKYIITAWVYLTQASSENAIYLSLSNLAQTIGLIGNNTVKCNPLIIGSWQKLSILVTSYPGDLGFMFRVYSYNTNCIVNIDDIIVQNLTEAYGAGNEPTDPSQIKSGETVIQYKQSYL